MLNLLVTCRPSSKLVELSADGGQCVREIALQPDIAAEVHHAAQLTSTGQLVVCHGAWTATRHRVCLLDADGAVSRSHGGQRGSESGQLDWPRHVAVDEDSQFIYAADRNNDRVVLLSPTLELVRVFSEGLTQPRRLYLHHQTRRLFVGLVEDGVTVIQL